MVSLNRIVPVLLTLWAAFPHSHALLCYVCEEPLEDGSCPGELNNVEDVGSGDQRCVSWSMQGKLMRQDVFTEQGCRDKVKSLSDRLMVAAQASFKCCDEDLCNTTPDGKDLEEAKKRLERRNKDRYFYNPYFDGDNRIEDY